MSDQARLDSEIVAAVENEWNAKQAPLLFSQLGATHLSPEVKYFIKENEISLKRYIRSNLSDQLRIVPLVRQGGGVAPASRSANMSDTQLEEAFQTSRHNKPPAPRGIRFKPEIWSAFHSLIPEGNKIIVKFDNNIISKYMKQKHEDLIEGEFSIESSEIPDPSALGTPVSSGEIYRAIVNWCSKNGIDQRLVTNNKYHESSSEIDRSRATNSNSSPSVNVDLLTFLRALPKDQLTKLNFPGDVLLSILELMARR